MASSRPRRKCSDKKKTISTSYYVGYADDSETPEEIMSKFAALEKLEEKKRLQPSKTEADEPGEAKEGYTEEELEEVFRVTSRYTKRQLRELELYGPDFVDFAGEDDEEYDSDLELYDDETGGTKRRRRGGTSVTSSRGVKTIVVEMRDEFGHVFTLKKRVVRISPTETVVTRIPNDVPLSWAPTIKPWIPPEIAVPSPGPDMEVQEVNLETDNLEHVLKGQVFSAALVDPPSLSALQNIRFDFARHVPNGFVFVWIEKHLQYELLKYFDRFDFQYVENICWVKRQVNNMFTTQPSPFFAKGHDTLLVLRRTQPGKDVELRHQRNPDVCFDFVRTKSDGLNRECKPEFVYTIIETLLNKIPEVDSEGCIVRSQNPPSLLEMWAESKPRVGWRKIVNK